LAQFRPFRPPDSNSCNLPIVKQVIERYPELMFDMDSTFAVLP